MASRCEVVDVMGTALATILDRQQPSGGDHEKDRGETVESLASSWRSVLASPNRHVCSSAESSGRSKRARDGTANPDAMASGWP